MTYWNGDRKDPRYRKMVREAAHYRTDVLEMKQSEVADCLGLKSSAHVSKWECGQTYSGRVLAWYVIHGFKPSL